MTATATIAAPEIELSPAPPPIPKLRPSGMRRAEHARTSYFVSPPPTADYDAVKEPIYWTHVASQLRPGDMIEVWPEDRSYWALLLVTGTGDNTAKVEELVFRKIIDAADDNFTPLAGYRVDWRGPNGRYAVVRDADKSVIQGNFTTKEEAQTWMIQNKRQLLA